MELTSSFPLVYFGSKYLLAVVCFWLTVHFWVTGKFGPSGEVVYDIRPWLARHPTAMIALTLALGGILLCALDHLKPEYEQVYYNLLVAGAPFFYSWFALIVIGAGASLASIAYKVGSTRIGGMASFATVVLAALVVPYYIRF